MNLFEEVVQLLSPYFVISCARFDWFSVVISQRQMQRWQRSSQAWPLCDSSEPIIIHWFVCYQWICFIFKDNRLRQMAAFTSLSKWGEHPLDSFSIKTKFWMICFLLYQLNRFYVALRLFSNRSQKTSRYGKNIRILSFVTKCMYRIHTKFLWNKKRGA